MDGKDKPTKPFNAIVIGAALIAAAILMNGSYDREAARIRARQEMVEKNVTGCFICSRMSCCYPLRRVSEQTSPSFGP